MPTAPRARNPESIYRRSGRFPASSGRIVGHSENVPVEKVMTRAFRDVLKIQMERQVSMRLAANIVGVGRVAEAVKIRGLYP